MPTKKTGMIVARIGAGTLPTVITKAIMRTPTDDDRDLVTKWEVGELEYVIDIVDVEKFLSDGDHAKLDDRLIELATDFGYEHAIFENEVTVAVDVTNDQAYRCTRDIYIDYWTMQTGRGEPGYNTSPKVAHRLHALSETKRALNPRGVSRVKFHKFEGWNTIKRNLIEATGRPPKEDNSNLDAITDKTADDVVLSIGLAFTLCPGAAPMKWDDSSLAMPRHYFE